MIARWFSSKAVREALQACVQVRKRMDAQRDLLPPQGAQALHEALAEVSAASSGNAEPALVRKASERMQRVAEKWLPPYPNAGIRENVDVALVALAVAMAIRTFFLQPMAIPTGSMQPTLFGITAENLLVVPHAGIPSAVTRFLAYCFRGTRYIHVRARADGIFEGFEKPRAIPLVSREQFRVGNEAYSVWFAPEGFERLSGLVRGQSFRAGDDILKLKVKSGDRLFADRFTFNFRRPHRGEIVIFETTGIPGLPPGTHYIKRLVGLGGERVRLLDDRHVEIDRHRLDAATPGFESIYSFLGPPADSKYSGHVNDATGRQFGFDSRAPLFPDATTVREIEPRHYLVLGDNTMNSSDSRTWGTFPVEKVIGRCGFVFWPISDRFGWGFR